jgi:hypothetical protein
MVVSWLAPGGSDRRAVTACHTCDPWQDAHTKPRLDRQGLLQAGMQHHVPIYARRAYRLCKRYWAITPARVYPRTSPAGRGRAAPPGATRGEYLTMSFPLDCVSYGMLGYAKPSVLEKCVLLHTCEYEKGSSLC